MKRPIKMMYLSVVALTAISLFCVFVSQTPVYSETDQQIELENESLQKDLDALAAASRAKQSPQVASVLSDSLDQIKKSGVVESALKVGQEAPNFTLPDIKNKKITLTNLLKKGPVVVCFYRGGWCPYCNLTLHALEKALPQIKEAKGTLVAISPQVPDQSIVTAKKDELHFEVLSDVGNKTSKDFGVAYKVPSELVALSNKSGVNYAKYNGDDSNELPLAATFIVKKDGKIAYSFVNADYTKRMEPSQIVADLKQISLTSSPP